MLLCGPRFTASYKLETPRQRRAVLELALFAMHALLRASALSAALFASLFFAGARAEEVTVVASSPSASVSPLCTLAEQPTFRVVGVLQGKDPLVHLMLEHNGHFQVIGVAAAGASNPLTKGIVLDSTKVEWVKRAKEVWPTFKKQDRLSSLFALPNGIAFVYKDKTELLDVTSNAFSPHANLDPNSTLFLDENGQGALYFTKSGFWFYREAAYKMGSVWTPLPPFIIFETEYPNSRSQSRERLWFLSLNDTLGKIDGLKLPVPVSWKWAAGYQAFGERGLHHLYTDQGVYLYEAPLQQMPFLGLIKQIIATGAPVPAFPLKVLKLNYSEHFACGALSQDPEKVGGLFSLLLYIPEKTEPERSRSNIRYKIIYWLLICHLITFVIMIMAILWMYFLQKRRSKASDDGEDDEDEDGDEDSSGSSSSSRKSSRSKSKSRRKSQRKTKSKKSAAPSTNTTPSVQGKA